MRVVVTSGGYDRGIAGADLMATNTTAQIAERGHSVVFVGGSHARDLVRRSADVIVAEPDDLDRFGDALPAPDVVHAYDCGSPRGIAMGLELATATRAPLVVTPCTHPHLWPDRALAETVCRRASFVFALTRAEATALGEAGATPDRIRRISQGPHLTHRSDPAGFRQRLGLAEAPTILFLGRRSATKGMQALVDAIPVVHEQTPSAHFLFGGQGWDGADGSVPVGDGRVRDLGWLDQQVKHDAVAASDVLCLPSVADVFPVAFVEAWTCGTAVVSGNFVGASEVVRHGTDGLVVDASPDALATALVSLSSDPQLARRLGQAGRARARRELTWAVVADEVERAYEELAATHKRMAVDQ